MSKVDTGGGTTVDGDAHTQDFVGRDRINIDFSQSKQQSTLEERVMDLERMVYGHRQWSEPGLIKRQQRQLYISVTNMILTLLTFVLLLLSLWR